MSKQCLKIEPSRTIFSLKLFLIYSVRKKGKKPFEQVGFIYDNSTLRSQNQNLYFLQLRKHTVISFPEEFRGILLLILRSNHFSPPAIESLLPPCFELFCSEARSTQSYSASRVAQELIRPFRRPSFSAPCSWRKRYPS